MERGRIVGLVIKSFFIIFLTDFNSWNCVIYTSVNEVINPNVFLRDNT